MINLQSCSSSRSSTTAPIASNGALPDVQASRDVRRVRIDKVGVSQVRYPISVRMANGEDQATVATVNLFVSLPEERKGTHMSRFLEVLRDYAQGVSPQRLQAFACELLERLDAQDAHVELEFTTFIGKPAPVTGNIGLMDYGVRMCCHATPGGIEHRLSVAASGTSLCPCSKEISAFGAHNQRCRIAAEVVHDGTLSIEDLAQVLESAGSAEVYAVLKRPDEKFVTEQAYESPKFVEDIIRDLALAMDEVDEIGWYRISSENFESIHSHNAFAMIERARTERPS